MADYKLTYFNVKGLAEGIRFIFAYADVEFEDIRIAKADWPAMKEQMPFGTLPILEVDGKVLNQSICICRYLGKKFGLVAEDPFTEAQLEALIDNIRDVQIKLKNSFALKTPESQQESAEAMKFLLDRLEPLASEGYFYGSEPTWVDIYFAGMFDTINDYMPNPLEGYPTLLELAEKIKSKDGVQKYIENKPAPEPHNHQ